MDDGISVWAVLLSDLLGSLTHTAKNLVDGQFESGVPGVESLVSLVQAWARWGPNLLLADAVKGVYERATLIDMLTWLMEAANWSLNTIYTPDVAFTMEYNTF